MQILVEGKSSTLAILIYRKAVGRTLNQQESKYISHMIYKGVPMDRIIQICLEDFLLKNPKFIGLEDSMVEAFNVIRKSFLANGKLLICGNGGSASDADHIVGELMKGFKQKRDIPADLGMKMDTFDEGRDIKKVLQLGLPAISLSAHSALVTAVANDISADMIFAQQVLGYGNEKDVLLAISTSGKSTNVINALVVAKSLGMKTIGLTGVYIDKMCNLCDVTIASPDMETAHVQESHVILYHILCEMIERYFFGNEE